MAPSDKRINRNCAIAMQISFIWRTPSAGLTAVYDWQPGAGEGESWLALNLVET